MGASFFLIPLLEFFRLWPEFRMLMFALVILVFLLYMPEGIFPWLRDKLEHECPRCKVRNNAARKVCRVCSADIH